MKQIRILLGMAVLLLLPVLYFTGCSEKGEVNSPNELNFESAQFAVIDFTDAENSVEDGTIETPLAINSVLSSYSFLNMGGGFTAGGPMMKGNLWLERFDFGKHLGLFFRRLKLTDVQKTQLKDFMAIFHETMKPLVQEFKDANSDIITKANADRKIIVDKVKAGELSRADAAPLLKALNDATRDAINSNPKTVVVKTKMCAARTQLFASVRGVLTGDQVTMFENWIKLIKNPC